MGRGFRASLYLVAAQKHYKMRTATGGSATFYNAALKPRSSRQRGVSKFGRHAASVACLGPSTMHSDVYELRQGDLGDGK